MYKITNVRVEGFWGNRIIDTVFDSSINIFIGSNGTGKTTFMNLLQAVLVIDFSMLGSIEFTKIVLNLKRRKSVRTIMVIKEDTNKVLYKLKYKIGRKVFEFPLIGEDLDPRKRRLHSRFLQEINDCRALLNEIVSLSWLSVHRELLDEDYEERYYYKRRRTFKSPVDARIEDLLERFTSYQLNVEREINKHSKQYQTDVLAGLLYNKKFDTFSVKKELNINPEDIKKGLLTAYHDLNAMNSEIEKKIEMHSDVISKSLENLSSSIGSDRGSEDPSIDLNDVLPIILLKRTNHIISLSKELEKEKKRIFEPLNNYISQIKSFIQNKEFILTPDGNLPFIIKTNDQTIGIEKLSSGEKQLFILLTETLLQTNKDYIFVADEPELSLHISWQKKLLKSIKSLNKNAQIIVATHSPEIAALWKKNIKKMEDIVE